MPREYPKYPIVGVGVVVIGPNGILLIKRIHPPGIGKWSLPGGAQEVGETVAQTAQREVFEETGINVEVLGHLDVIDSMTHDDNNRVQYHYTLIDMAARVTGGKLIAGDDAAEARWFSMQELSQLNLWSETIRIIDLAIKKYSS